MTKLACITGATSGLGLALASLLSEQGIPLLLVARDSEKLRDLASRLPSPVIPFPCDLSCLEERASLLAMIEEKAPDLVINNAGSGLYGPILSHSLSAFQDMLSLNVQASIDISIVAARTLLQRRAQGHIVNISSAAAHFPFPYFAVYAASKTCIQSFSQAFDEEIRKHNVRILTAIPGQIDTPFRFKASSFHPHKKGLFTMSPEKAARAILRQIQKNKQTMVLDWRYALALRLSSLVPRSFLFSFLKRSLYSRIPLHRMKMFNK